MRVEGFRVPGFRTVGLGGVKILPIRPPGFRV